MYKKNVVNANGPAKKTSSNAATLKERKKMSLYC